MTFTNTVSLPITDKRGVREKAETVSKQQICRIEGQKLFKRNASGPDDESLDRREFFLEYPDAVIGGAAAAFYFYCDALVIVFENKIYFVVTVAPVIHSVACFIRHIEQMCTYGVY